MDAEDAMDVAETDGLPDALDRRAKRGNKRQAGQEEDGNSSTSPKKAGKRARRQSRKFRDLESEAKLESGAGEGSDQIMDLDLSTSSARGKKRDRAEAGSTFGGDDESPLGHGRKIRRRKRKSVATVVENGSVDSWARGTKRSYDLESTMDSDEEHPSRFKASRKRGKRTVTDPNDSSDISMDDIRIVRDPACGGRKIGEEWEFNGERFKVGQDGRRLRQVLIKKRKSRYSMVSGFLYCQFVQHTDSCCSQLTPPIRTLRHRLPFALRNGTTTNSTGKLKSVMTYILPPSLML